MSTSTADQNLTTAEIATEAAKLVVKQANKTAKQVTAQAAEVAKTVVQVNQRSDIRTAELIVAGIQEFFDKADKEKRFIDTQRIPFICDDIKNIKKDMSNLSRLIYIGIGIVSAISVLNNFILK